MRRWAYLGHLVNHHVGTHVFGRSGGDMIFGFAIALLVGVTIGTYSSICVASTSLLALGVTKEDVAIPVKEGEDQEALTP